MRKVYTSLMLSACLSACDANIGVLEAPPETPFLNGAPQTNAPISNDGPVDAPVDGSETFPAVDAGATTQPQPPPPNEAPDAGPPSRPVPPANAMTYAEAMMYAAGCTEGGGSGLSTNDAMIQHINTQRRSFTSHPQISGYPWRGLALENGPTWKTVLIKHPELMERAQIFAAELGRGGTPLGREYPYQNRVLYPKYDSESMWLDGLESPEYRISALSKFGLTTGPSSGVMKWENKYNGTIRQALFYQSGMEPWPNKHFIGVGRACMPNGDVWWVVLVAQYP